MILSLFEMTMRMASTEAPHYWADDRVTSFGRVYGSPPIDPVNDAYSRPPAEQSLSKRLRSIHRERFAVADDRRVPA